MPLAEATWTCLAPMLVVDVGCHPRLVSVVFVRASRSETIGKKVVPSWVGLRKWPVTASWIHAVASGRAQVLQTRTVSVSRATARREDVLAQEPRRRAGVAAFGQSQQVDPQPCRRLNPASPRKVMSFPIIQRECHFQFLLSARYHP
jgi:hypothetical protein